MFFSLKNKRREAFVFFCWSLLLLLGLTWGEAGAVPKAVEDAPEKSFSVPVELDENWSYRWGDFLPNSQGQEVGEAAWFHDDSWSVMEEFGTPKGREGEDILWLKVRLPEGSWPEPSLLVHRLFLNFQAYIAGQEVYHFGEISRDGSFQFAGVAWHMIPLRKEWLGRTIYFRVASDIRRIGLKGPVLIGSGTGLISQVVTEDLGSIVVGFLSLFLAFAALVLYARHRAEKVYLSFAVFAASIGIYILCLSRVHQLFIYAPRFFFGCWVGSTAFLPVGLIAFFEHLFGPGRNKILRRLWQFYAVLAVVSLLLYGATLQVSTIEPLLDFSRFCYLASAFLLCVALWPGLRRKNIEAMIFALGFGCFLFFALHNTLIFLHVQGGRYLQIEYGMFFFLVSLAVILVRRFVIVHSKLALFAKKLQCNAAEREQMLQDLHDGVGGLVTNIKLLSEMGKESHSIDHLKKTLGTVTDLSRNSLEEISTFLDVLDEKEITWKNLAAEFRHYGVTAIEPHNMTFSMQANIQDEIDLPGNFISVNLLKIYREAITNIIKHSQGTLVDIRFNLSQTMLDLSICNDGAVCIAGERRGHGLGSMKKRAASIGAQLDVSFAQEGARVQLNMPLPK